MNIGEERVEKVVLLLQSLTTHLTERALASLLFGNCEGLAGRLKAELNGLIAAAVIQAGKSQSPSLLH